MSGDGTPVMLIAGLFRGDRSLEFLAAFLRSAGFDACTGGIDRNLDCSEAMVERLSRRLETIVERRQQPVALVGHSRGGLFARVLARRRPELVSGVVTLGSPHQDPLAVHPILWAALLTVASLGRFGARGVFDYSCAVGGCCERFRRDLVAPLPPGVGHLSVYSRQDGLVDWRSCVNPHGDQLEVTTSHRGMPEDATVLRAIASAVVRFAGKDAPSERDEAPAATGRAAPVVRPVTTGSSLRRSGRGPAERGPRLPHGSAGHGEVRGRGSGGR
ncbi:MAG: alpha/beta hydrolase, partial [Actinomycetota bacterium]|nr:alpha/beta hydrolase [Actinomycetota bacterium]